MKVTRILIVSIILLSVLTIGAVSAQDSNNALTLSNDTEDTIYLVEDIDLSPEDGSSNGDLLLENDNTGNEAYGEDYSDYEDDGLSETDDEQTSNETFDFEIVTSDEIAILEETKISAANLPNDLDGYFSVYFDNQYYDEILIFGEQANVHYTFNELGTHIITFKYSGDYKYAPVEKTKEINITKYNIRFSNYEYFYGSNTIYLEVPNGFDGTVNVNFKGKTYQVSFDEYSYGYEFSTDLTLGENTFNIYYEGDEKFGELNSTFTVNCLPSIAITDWTSYYNDDTLIYLYLPTNATGTLSVYSMSENEETGEYEYAFISSSNVTDGYASIPISKLVSGRLSLHATFEGSQEVNEKNFYLYIQPNIEIPKYIFSNSTLEITYDISPNETADLTVYKRVIVNPEDYTYEDVVLKHVESTGKTVINIDGLKDGKYEIIIKKEEDNELDEIASQNVYVINSTDAKLEFKYPLPKEVLRISELYINITLPEYVTGNVSIYVDGKLVAQNVFYLNCENFTLGNHTLEVKFESDEFENASVTDTFEIKDVIIEIPEKFIGDVYEHQNWIKVSSLEDATGYVECYVDGELYKNTTLKANDNEFDYVYKEAYIELKNLSPGNHSVEVIYSGDDKYPRTNKVAEVLIDYRMTAGATDIIYGEEGHFYLTLPEDITSGDIIATINGEPYEVNYENGAYRLDLIGLDVGNYTVSITYTGDKKYVHKTVNETFCVFGEIKRTSDNSYDAYHWGDENDSISIILPDDAKGSLVLNITDFNTNTVSSIEIPLVNGKASYNITQLGLGYYRINYAYSGNDYQVKDGYQTLELTTNVEFAYPSKMTIFDTQTINFTAPNIPNSHFKVLIIQHTGKYEEDEFYGIYEIVNTIAEKNITLLDGKASYKMENLSFGEYEVSYQYIVDEETVISNSEYFAVTPRIAADENIDLNKENNIIVTVPGDATGNVSFEIRDYNGEVIDSISQSLNNGVAVLTIPPHISYGHYYITYNGNYGKSSTEVYSYTHLNVTFPDYFNLTGPTVINYSLPGRWILYLYLDSETIEINVSGQGSIEIPQKYTNESRKFRVGLWDYEYMSGYVFEHYIKHRMAPNMEVNINTPVEGNDLIVNITLAKRATGSVFATINNKTYNATVNDGKAVIAISGLEAKMYNVSVTYEGDGAFEDYTQTVNAQVSEIEKIASEITVIANDEIIEGNDLTVEVKIINATGTVEINGKNITLENGTAKTTINGLPIGENIISITYYGDKIYSNATQSKNVTVKEKLNANLNISVANIAAGENATVNIEIDPSATGTVTVNDQTVEIKNGKATYTIKNPEVGNHNVTVNYSGDNTYKAIQKTASFNVSKLTPKITISTDDDIIEGNNLTVEVTVANATGNVNINGRTISLKNSKATTTFTDLLAGDMVINVEYCGDGTYSNATESKTVKVLSKSDANLKVSISSTKIDEDVIISISIDSAATGDITANGEKVTMTGGQGTYVIPKVKAGNHTVTVEFAGDGKFNKTSQNVTFTVNKIVPEITVDSIAGKTPTLKITLPSDATGNVLVSAGGMNQTQTLEKGTATITLTGLKVGTYEATVTYSGDGKYLTATAKANATVLTDAKIVASNKAVYYNAGSKYSVTVYGTDGKVAQGTYVTFKVAGKTVAKVKTNTKGVASFKVKQIPKTYKVSATALAKTVTKKLTVKHVVTLKTAVVKKSAKQLVLQATLKQGKTALKNKIVKFKFNGKTYKVKTNKKGIAKLIIKKTVLSKLKVGKKLTYQATYLKDTVKKTVKVKK